MSHSETPRFPRDPRRHSTPLGTAPEGTATGQDPPSEQWERAGPIDEFATGELRAVRVAGHQLVIARTPEGELRALDNRCPHEGYPLAQGTLQGTALTCCWHNWKFDIDNGACLLGGEGVRAFPVRVVQGPVEVVLEVDVADAPFAERFEELRASLGSALFDGDLERAIRDGLRLLQLGVGPRRVLTEIASYDARHAEYGTSHALAVAADAGRLLAERSGAQAMYAIAPALDVCADANRRLPERRESAAGAGEALPHSHDVGNEQPSARALRDLAEGEQAAECEELVRRAFALGRTRAEVEAWLFGTLSEHFTDFGHQLIYLIKTRELLDGLEQELLAEGQPFEAVQQLVAAYAAQIYPGLAFSAALGTREDTLPYMRSYTEFVKRVEADFETAWGRASEGAPFDPDSLRNAVLEGRSEEALEALWSAARSGVSAERLARALVSAGAHRLLRYDPRLERDAGVAENFVWATHRFTFASAVRNAVRRFESPDALRFLFQALAFIHSGRAMDEPASARPDLAQLGEQACGRAADPQAVLAALRDGLPEDALVATLACLRGGGQRELRLALEEFVLSDPVVRPIAVAHVIKTTLAAFEEFDALEDSSDREVPLLAAVRTWALPLVERRVRASVSRAIDWVVEGRVPRKLTQ